MRFASFAFASTLAALFASASPARADEPPTPPPTAPTPDAAPSDTFLRIQGGPSFFGAGDGAGVLATGTLLAQWGLLTGGVTGSAGLSVGSNYYELASVGLLAGFASPRDPRGWSFAVLGQYGVQAYGNHGMQFFVGNDPGGSATVPYAGARLLVLRSFKRFEVGPTFDVTADLQRETTTYTYSDPEACECPSGHSTGTATIGTVRIGFGVAIGGAIDL